MFFGVLLLFFPCLGKNVFSHGKGSGDAKNLADDENCGFRRAAADSVYGGKNHGANKAQRREACAANASCGDALHALFINVLPESFSSREHFENRPQGNKYGNGLSHVGNQHIKAIAHTSRVDEAWGKQTHEHCYGTEHGASAAESIIHTAAGIAEMSAGIGILARKIWLKIVEICFSAFFAGIVCVLCHNEFSDKRQLFFTAALQYITDLI